MTEFLNAHYLGRLCEIYSKGEFLRMQKNAIQKIQKFDIIVAGVKKCGTSSLQLFMRYHPELQGHNFYAHEGHYFDIGTVFSYLVKHKLCFVLYQKDDKNKTFCL